MRDRTATACPWCGDWPNDEDRCGEYCRKCNAEKVRRYRARRRDARLSRWYAEVGTADAERAAMLASAIVDELGGYDRAAKQLVGYVQQVSESGKAPGELARAVKVLMRLIERGAPAE